MVYFKNERGVLIEQKVQYDWKPMLCKHRKKYGHSETECRKKNLIVKEARRVERNVNSNPVEGKTE